MKKVAVVILNYNGKKFLEKFLPTVIEHSAEVADIIVADNASTDDSVDFMRTAFPGIRLILNESNGGFSTGYNLALRQVEAKYTYGVYAHSKTDRIEKLMTKWAESRIGPTHRFTQFFRD